MGLSKQQREELRRKKTAELYANMYEMAAESQNGKSVQNACIVGLDEVGRGSLAGPLCVAAVVLPKEPQIVGLDDSKKVTPKRREVLAKEIEALATSIGLSFIEPAFIDEYGMSKAIKQAFSQALNNCMEQLSKKQVFSKKQVLSEKPSTSTKNASAETSQTAQQEVQQARQTLCSSSSLLEIEPDVVFVDGNPLHIHKNECNVLKGDAKIACISAASIYAKVKRDTLMQAYAKKYSQYGFDEHKGYGTKKHIAAIKEFGPCCIHRRSFLCNILS